MYRFKKRKMLRVVGQRVAAVATAARRSSVQLQGAAHARLLSAATSSIEMRPMTRRLADGVLQGNRTALSRSITLGMSRLPDECSTPLD